MNISKNGQVAIEYIAIAGVILAILIPLFYFSFNTTNETITESQAEDAVFSLASAANEVYALSPGSKREVWVQIPGGTNSVIIQENEISLNIHIAGRVSDYVAFTKPTIVGTIPLDKGTHRISVELLSSGIVQIGEANDTTPPVITWTAPTDITCNPVTLRVNTDEPSICKFDTNDVDYESMDTAMEGNAIGHSYLFGVQSENNYSYYVRCEDSFNNVMNSSTFVSYSIDFAYCTGSETINDTIPPIVTSVAPESSYISNSSQVQFSYNVTDDSSILLCGLQTNESLINSVVTPPMNTLNTISGDLDLGNYSWYINCTDAFGNSGQSEQRQIEINATLDTDLPIVTLTAPDNNSIRNFNLVRFFYNVTDSTSDIHSCSLSIYGQLDEEGTSSQSISDFSVTEDELQSLSLSLDKGNHTWNVSCLDDGVYRNSGISETRLLRINTTSTETYITSCPGQCEFEGFSNGVCRQSIPKCEQNSETNAPDGNQFCTGGSQSDTCCCIP
ncbi:hypothetical protein HOI26_01650 [Candidatus Woesearchaeota archaeon]|nr:hypothetical protein [Candidatus Woesearchaeota archaeon]MBT5739780.1 hypothetical protein [Candidatus Woesearchaeota archaeon]